MGRASPRRGRGHPPLLAIASLVGLARWRLFAGAMQQLATRLHGHARPDEVREALADAFDDPSPHEHLIVLAIYLTVGLPVFAHGITAAPLADRSARWYEQHPRHAVPPMASAPAEVTRARGPAAQPS